MLATPARVAITEISPGEQMRHADVLSNERGDALSDEHEHVVTRAGHNCPITV
jgi:hypothetical protein